MVCKTFSKFTWKMFNCKGFMRSSKEVQQDRLWVQTYQLAGGLCMYSLHVLSVTVWAPPRVLLFSPKEMQVLG